MDNDRNSNFPAGLPPARIENLPEIILSEIEGYPMVRDLDLAERLGFDRPRDIRKLIERNIAEIEAFGVCATVARTPDERGGRPSIEYWLSEEQALLVATLSEATNAPAVRHMLIRVFVAWRRGHLVPANDALITVPNFSDPAAAARAWADQYEARLIAERTKAEIGTRREATAMNTASQAVKKATKLELELDRSMQYATVKRMELLYHGQKFAWRELKSVAAEIGVPPIKIFDANYGTVNAYHAAVWREAYALEIPTSEATA